MLTKVYTKAAAIAFYQEKKRKRENKRKG